ncbi:MAG: hypothetical protein GY880_25055 [Planctomycetaceae bacterium]|nr:hypothetical protein [Planctomycetaceae bacterium]MCP4477878.1 hypothetical protein [Planctomycetaceae bacterium]MCP4777501.1 hypothetical protein [Planctomycetaceae bacterium]
MNKRPSTSPGIPKITAKKLLSAIIIVLIIAYQWYAESTSVTDTVATPQPSVFSTTTSQTPGNATATLEHRYLRDGRGENLLSPAGLVYTSGRSGHRSKHVMRHASDEPDRPGPHGVFDAQGDDVFRLIDEAYELIQSGSNRVKTIPEGNGKTEYIINMNRRIGYLGGETGARKNHPSLDRLNLVLGENRVITAYPY